MFFMCVIATVYISTSPAGAVAKYCNEHICVSVCLTASASISPELHARSLPIFQCMLPVAMARSSSSTVTKLQGLGVILRVVRAIQKHWQSSLQPSLPRSLQPSALHSLQKASVNHRHRGIIQQCQASANRNPDNYGCRQCGLLAGKGVMGVHNAGKV